MDIHTYFNLTYSSHLVIDPATLRNVPQETRDQIDAMIDQLERAFPDVNRAGDEMLAVAAVDREYNELTDIEMEQLNITAEASHDDCLHADDDDDNCDQWDTRFYDWRGDHHYSDEYTTVPTETDEQARAARRRVVSRTLLQSMPEDWQERLVAQLRIADVAAEGPESYDIRFYTRDGHRTTDPVPHYRRGRTYIEPHLEALA